MLQPGCRGPGIGVTCAWRSCAGLGLVFVRISSFGNGLVSIPRKPQSGCALFGRSAAPIFAATGLAVGVRSRRVLWPRHDKLGLRVDVAHLCSEDQGIHESGAFTPMVDTCEAPGLAPNGFTARGSFGGVVRQSDVPFGQ